MMQILWHQTVGGELDEKRKIMRVGRRENQALIREKEVSALNVSSASQSGSLKIIRNGQLSHVTVGATDHTMLGHNRNDRKRIWRRHTNSYKKQIIRGKKFNWRKKGIPPSPQVFRNSFDKMYGTKSRYCLKPKLIT